MTRCIFCCNFLHPAILIKNKVPILPRNEIKFTHKPIPQAAAKAADCLGLPPKLGRSDAARRGWPQVHVRHIKKCSGLTLLINRYGWGGVWLDANTILVDVQNITNSQGIPWLDATLVHSKMATKDSKQHFITNFFNFCAYGCAWSHRRSQWVVYIPLLHCSCITPYNAW